MNDSMWGVMWEDGSVTVWPSKAEASAQAEKWDQDLVEVVRHD